MRWWSDWLCRGVVAPRMDAACLEVNSIYRVWFRVLYAGRMVHPGTKCTGEVPYYSTMLFTPACRYHMVSVLVTVCALGMLACCAS